MYTYTKIKIRRSLSVYLKYAYTQREKEGGEAVIGKFTQEVIALTAPFRHTAHRKEGNIPIYNT